MLLKRFLLAGWEIMGDYGDEEIVSYLLGKGNSYKVLVFEVESGTLLTNENAESYEEGQILMEELVFDY